MYQLNRLWYCTDCDHCTGSWDTSVTKYYNYDVCGTRYRILHVSFEVMCKRYRQVNNTDHYQCYH